MALSITPALGSGQTCYPITVGQQVDFNVAGGTSPYIWTSTNGIINSATGLYTAVTTGTGTVTVTDSTGSPLTANISICVGSQTQACAAVEPIPSIDDNSQPCCEFNTECGQEVQLRVPSFHLRVNGHKVPVDYQTFSGVTPGDYASIKANAANAYAIANNVNFAGADEALFEIVTNFDMAAIGNGEFELQWNDNAGNTFSVVWYTDTAVRYVEQRNNGIVEAGSKFAVVQGDLVSFGKEDGTFKLFINNLLKWTSAANVSGCGDYTLIAKIATAAKTIGGYVTNLTWSIVTAGSADTVGVVDGNGVYTSPDNPISGVVHLVGTVGSAAFSVYIRNIKPSLRFSRPDSFLANRKASVWVKLYSPGQNQVPLLASDGSPDATSGKWIDLGTLEASATFATDMQFQDFEDDEGIYFTGLTGERASLQGAFKEVRDYDKMARIVQYTTLGNLSKGYRTLSAGGKVCGRCELSILLVAEPQNCEEGFEAIFMPRAQERGNFSNEVGRKTNAKYTFNFQVLLDRTLPAGSQLFTMYQTEACSTSTSSKCN